MFYDVCSFSRNFGDPELLPYIPNNNAAAHALIKS